MDLSFDEGGYRGYMVVVSIFILYCYDADMCNHIRMTDNVFGLWPLYTAVTTTMDFAGRSWESRNHRLSPVHRRD